MRHFWTWGAVALCIGCRNPVREMRVTPSEWELGGTAKIEVVSDAPRNFTVTIGTRTYPMFDAGAGIYRTYVGFGADRNPGRYEAQVRKSEGGSVLFRSVVMISSRAFPSENITMALEKTKLTEDSSYAASQAKILSALAGVSPECLWQGAFALPARGRLTTGYGMQRTVNRTLPWPYHRGMDIAGPVGTPVSAANGGIVVVAERFPVQGRTVIVDHGQGVLTIYMHLAAIRVSVGDRVQIGDRLGDMGSDGFSTGPHLHWGVYVFGEPVDPRVWMNPPW